MTGNGPAPATGPDPQHVQPQFTVVTVSTALAEWNGKRLVLVVFHTVLGPIHFAYDSDGIDRLVSVLRHGQAELRGGLIVPDVQPPPP